MRKLLFTLTICVLLLSGCGGSEVVKGKIVRKESIGPHTTSCWTGKRYVIEDHPAQWTFIVRLEDGGLATVWISEKEWNSTKLGQKYDSSTEIVDECY
jgi:uncharacterized protein YceK